MTDEEFIKELSRKLPNYKDHQTIKCSCPVCSKELSGAFGEKTPVDGDISICLYCGSILCFRTDQTLRLLTHRELESLTKEEREEIQEAKTHLYEQGVL